MSLGFLFFFLLLLLFALRFLCPSIQQRSTGLARLGGSGSLYRPSLNFKYQIFSPGRDLSSGEIKRVCRV